MASTKGAGMWSYDSCLNSPDWTKLKVNTRRCCLLEEDSNVGAWTRVREEVENWSPVRRVAGWLPPLLCMPSRFLTTSLGKYFWLHTWYEDL